MSFLLFSPVVLLFDALTGKALGDGKHLTHKVEMTSLLTPLVCSTRCYASGNSLVQLCEINRILNGNLV